MIDPKSIKRIWIIRGKSIAILVHTDEYKVATTRAAEAIKLTSLYNIPYSIIEVLEDAYIREA